MRVSFTKVVLPVLHAAETPAEHGERPSRRQDGRQKYVLQGVLPTSISRSMYSWCCRGGPGADLQGFAMRVMHNLQVLQGLPTSLSRSMYSWCCGMARTSLMMRSPGTSGASADCRLQ